jgi:rhodanese-related sulfurtransferase
MTIQITLSDLQARRAANPGLTLLEALPEKYYLDGHLPGAKHFPHTLVKELAPRVLRDKDQEIVVYCASDTCQNSHIAARALTALGYTNVAVYGGGKKEWTEAGLPVERGGTPAIAA